MPQNTIIQHPELKTIRDFLRFATTSFNKANLYYGHGTDNAWDEAVALIFHTLQLSHDLPTSVLDAQLIENERAEIFSLIQKRIVDRIPVPYLTHVAWFAGLPFYVDERVLIPRSPISELIEQQFQPWIEDSSAPLNILDLCTGSGCIAIACAKAFNHAQIDASDISEEALQVAKINVTKHAMTDQVHLYQSDLFASMPEKKYDIIISNPPYVSVDETLNFPKEYQHEPLLALKAGEFGLDIVLRILHEATHFLKPNGILVVEVGNSEVYLNEHYPQIPFTWLQFQRGGDGVFLLTADEVKSLEKKYCLTS